MKSKGDPLGYRNESLFSDFLLTDILSEDEDWKDEWQIDEKELKEKRDFLASLYQKYKESLKGWLEQDLRDKFINPILSEVLGFHYGTKTTDAGTTPDYTLYLTEEDYREADTGKIEDPFTKAVIGEAKVWEKPLDDRSPDAPGLFDRRSPDYQTRRYIFETGVSWGILTNGRIWRLYHESSARKRNVFYEVDILSFVESQQKMFADFRFFYLFFRAVAFQKDGFLDKVRQQSIEHARGIGEDLEQNVYRALRILAQGFFDNDKNNLDIRNEEHIKQVHDNCLIFLYRILFTLYAEYLKHLPTDDTYYRDNFSLYGIKYEVESVLEGRSTKEYFSNRDTLWTRLKDLFYLINEGSEARGISKLQIPAYNGGLFKPDDHKFLEENWVGDKALAQVIDLLARGKVPKSPVKRFINYKELGVTKLGGIYEGLLENKLKIAAEPITAVQVGKKQLWVPTDKRGKRKPVPGEKEVKPGQLYPVTDKGERKATGSYYTPDYIVHYIVDHTLGPLCDEAAKEVKKLRPQIEKKIERLTSQSKAKGESQKKVNKAVEEEKYKIIEPYLKLKVLDPAMGSGHFLVYATRYIGERIRDDTNVAVVIEEHADDEVYWMRRVVERSIFGVDLNYLAVELAKLALWLETFSKDAPLSFLDHHLRQGNSLIGASVDQLGSLPAREKRKAEMERKGQLGITSRDFRERLRRAVASYKNIEDMVTDHITKVTKKEKQLEIARDALLRFREIGDVWASTYFGNKVEEKDYQALINAISSDKEWEKFEDTEWFKYADKQWHKANPKYFHWELEFPEMFFDEHGKDLKEDAGFDAVIGNPPYVRIQKLQETSPKDVNYYKKRYTAASEGNYDIYVVFVERGHSLLNETGRFGYILPHKFFNSQYGKPLRGYISKGKYLSHVVHFGHHQVFPEATSYTCLLFLRGDETKECHFVKVEDLGKWKSLGKASEGEITVEAITEDEWNFVVGKGSDFFYKLNQLPTKLGDVADIFVGLQTSADDVFIMDLVEELPSTLRLHSKALDVNLTFEKWLFFPLVSGTDVGRYTSLPNRQYVLFPYDVSGKSVKLIDFSMISKDYSKTAEYLLKNKNILEARENDRMKGSNWYGYIYLKNLKKQFLRKLCVPRLVERLFAAYDSEGTHFLDNVDVGGITLKEEYENQGVTYLLGLINSKLLGWYFPFVSAPFRGGWLSANRQFLSQLPIRTIDFSNPEDKKMHDKMVKLVQNMLDAQKRKQEITQNYITWLESIIGAKVDDLTNKETIRDPVKLKNIDELIKLLIKNRKKLKGFAPKRLAAQQEITDDFNQCKAQIDSIAAEISKTDREIDSLVYKLYGLTSEEIEIVEGGKNPCEDSE